MVEHHIIRDFYTSAPKYCQYGDHSDLRIDFAVSHLPDPPLEYREIGKESRQQTDLDGPAIRYPRNSKFVTCIYVHGYPSAQQGPRFCLGLVSTITEILLCMPDSAWAAVNMAQI